MQKPYNHDAPVKTGFYIMYVGKKKPNQVFEGVESLIKARALQTFMQTGKPVRLVEVEYTGENSVNEIREVINYVPKG